MRGLLGAVCLILAAPGVFAQVDVYAPLPRVWGAALSPDGTRLATGCSPRGMREICLYDLTGASPAKLIAQPDNGRIVDFFWPSENYLVYRVTSFQPLTAHSTDWRYRSVRRLVSFNVATEQGVVLLGNLGSLSAVDDIASPMLGRDDVVAMELTLALSGEAPTGSRLGDRRSMASAAYEVSLEDGSLREVLATSRGAVLDFVLTAEGEAKLEVRYDDGGGRYSIHRVEGGRRPEIFSGMYPAAIPHVRGFTDDQTALMVDFPRDGLRRLDIHTGEISRYQVAGIGDVSGMAPIFDQLSQNVVGFSYTDSLPRQVFIEESFASLQAELRQVLTEDSIVLRSWDRDLEKVVIVARDVGQPANYYLLDLSTGQLGLYDVELVLEEGRQVGAREFIRYTASDGLEIEAWLTTPPGDAGTEGRPLVLLPHGGPQSRDTGQYDWMAAFYASLGYAVLQPNFRGSTGRGQDFVAAGHGGFGTRMIDDIIDGARHLQQSGVARPGSYCVVGGSYGGYAALMVALRDRDNVACAVAFAAVTQPFAMLAGREFGANVRYWEEYMGSRFDDAAYRDSITPTARMSEFRAPLLLLHGDQDTTVPFGQMDAFRRASGGNQRMRFVTLQGETHYLDNQAVRDTLLRESGAFLAEHLPVD